MKSIALAIVTIGFLGAAVASYNGDNLIIYLISCFSFGYFCTIFLREIVSEK